MVEMKFHCSMPIFVARQWIRHRTASVNEMSGRYSLLPMLFYTPAEDQLRPQDAKNKQGRDGAVALDADKRRQAYDMWKSQRTLSMDNYGWLTDNDFARELARIDLPLSTYTQWYWKIDLKNLLHFLGLRVDSHAQWEIQQFGKIMAGMLKRVAPLAYESWIDYEVCGVRMSRMEMDLIRKMLDTKHGQINPRSAVTLQNGVITSKQFSVTDQDFLAAGMSSREVEEFLSNLQDKAVPDFELDLTVAKDGKFFEEQAAAAALSSRKS
jgi:thymidylate synthase (FAD)